MKQELVSSFGRAVSIAVTLAVTLAVLAAD